MRINQHNGTDLHRRLLDRHGARGEAVYVLLCGFFAIAVNGLAACFLKQALLFPSLSPTVFAFFRQPLSEEASQRNAVVGHLVAAAVGFAALYAFGLHGEQSVL